MDLHKEEDIVSYTKTLSLWRKYKLYHWLLRVFLSDSGYIYDGVYHLWLHFLSLPAD